MGRAVSSASADATRLTAWPVTPEGGEATRGRWSALPLLCLLVGLLLGVGLYVTVELRKADERGARAAAQVALLDREISSRIYQWLDRAEEMAGGGTLAGASAPLRLYGQLLARPVSMPGADTAMAPTVPELSGRSFVSLVLELGDLLEEPLARRQVARVAALLVRADELLGDCATPRECTRTVAMNILLDRWRR